MASALGKTRILRLTRPLFTPYRKEAIMAGVSRPFVAMKAVFVNPA